MLAELEKGATSILLGLRGAAGPLDQVLAEVLDGVYLDLAGIVLDAGPAFDAAAAALHGVAKANDVPPSALIGTLILPEPRSVSTATSTLNAPCSMSHNSAW